MLKKEESRRTHKEYRSTILQYTMGSTQSSLSALSSLNTELTMSFILSARPHTRKEIKKVLPAFQNHFH